MAGTLGGGRLEAVAGHAVRPTADRVREALFSRLESRYGLRGVCVLDLFAGTGALGIEAVSRGATRLVSVEKDRQAARVLIDNLRALGIEGRAELIVAEVAATIRELEEAGRRFDGIFVDPPYRQGLAQAVLELLGAGSLLAAGAWVSVETQRGETAPERVGCLLRVREDLYGDTKMALYEFRADQG